ncbi:oligosaccharide flippase family protein [Kaistia terrae]|uniref:Oligosaccharide flippase family protein n=1 Tax=Kaistia terrae TaxID=537017 RepID=A0ABW0PRR5_9HYPH|nr:oligosaccharide flippase family protein [Kaistia terrae]MCX5577649.1 oligosaccharide flippase family protein [Kaistia terrae]
MIQRKTPRLLGWIGWAGADAIGRLALLTGSTVILSRMLEPRDFGISALVLTLVAVASVCVGAPFEEALAQRRALRRSHLGAALAAAWLVALVLFALSIPGGFWLGNAYGEPQMRLLLPVAMLSIFFSGHSDIATALARRLHRFNDVAFATLGGHAIGIALALAIAFGGGGIWALIAQRLLVVVARAILLQWRLGFLILPRWSRTHLGHVGRFARISFFDRLADNLTYLAFNNLVGALYGITVLGYVNMAMRLIEPIRGAIIATSHNLAFSYFASAGDDPRRLRDRLEPVVANAAFVIAPLFIGMAAVTPILLPIVAGPGWDAAIPIAICLAIGAAILLPARLVYTALSASARPEFSLIAALSGFGATMALLVLATPLGPISVGLSRLVGDGFQALFAVGLPARHLAWSRIDRFRALLPAYGLASIMGVVVAASGFAMDEISRPLALILSVAIGVVCYVGLLIVFARPTLRTLLGILRPSSRLATTAES